MFSATSQGYQGIDLFYLVAFWISSSFECLMVPCIPNRWFWYFILLRVASSQKSKFSEYRIKIEKKKKISYPLLYFQAEFHFQKKANAQLEFI